MQTMKLKYMGSVPTRVSEVRGAEKIDVQPGDTVEIEEVFAKEIAASYKGVWVPVDQLPTEKKQPASKPEGEIEGGLDKSKVQTTVPKKSKNS